MANISYPQLVHNIGVAIKEKTGLDSLKYGEIAQAISDIPSGDSVFSTEVNIHPAIIVDNVNINISENDNLEIETALNFVE